MIIRLGRHVFGTRRGYRTLAASDDLLPEEIQELEVLSFGQTSDSAYLDSLKDTPAYWSRMLSSGKRAITRVFRGAPDDKGRPTLLLVTVLVGAEDWVRVLSAAEHVLLAERRLWDWDGGSELSQLDIGIEPPIPLVPTAAERRTLLSLVGMIEEYIGDRNVTIVFTEGELGLRTVQLLPSLLPPEVRRSFSYAVRSLSEGLPVALNVLASPGSRGKSRRRIVGGAQPRDYRHREFAGALAHFWPQGQPPPWEFVANCRRFGRLHLVHADVEAAVGGTGIGSARLPGLGATPTPQSRGRLRLVIRILVLVIGLGVVAAAVATRRAAMNEQKALAQKVADFLDGNPIGVCATSDECEDRVPLHKAEDLKQRLGTYRTLPPSLQSIKEQLDTWLDEAESRRERYAKLEQRLNTFDDPYAEELGLYALSDHMRLPGTHDAKQVHDWKQCLMGVENEAASVATPLANRARDRLEKLNNWEKSVEQSYERYRRELDDIQQFLSPPRIWSAFTIGELETHKNVIARLTGLFKDAPASADTAERGALRAQLNNTLMRSAAWTIGGAISEQLARARAEVAHWSEAQCPAFRFLCGFFPAFCGTHEPFGAAED